MRDGKMVKMCSSCKLVLPIDQFSLGKSQPDGYQGYCRDCAKKHSRKYHETNRDSIIRRNSEWHKKNPEKVIDLRRRKAAHSRVATKLSDAVKSGKIKRGSCIICGQPNAEGHHEDYTKPYDVIWLCSLHHARWHAGDYKLDKIR